jgi:hypothetical protein
VRARPFPFSIRLQSVGFANFSHSRCDVWRSCASSPRSLATRHVRARPCARKSEAKSEGKSSSAPPGLNRGALGVASGVAPHPDDEATRSAVVHTTSSQSSPLFQASCLAILLTSHHLHGRDAFLLWRATSHSFFAFMLWSHFFSCASPFFCSQTHCGNRYRAWWRMPHTHHAIAPSPDEPGVTLTPGSSNTTNVWSGENQSTKRERE